MEQTTYLEGPAADTTVVDPKSNQTVNVLSLVGHGKL